MNREADVLIGIPCLLTGGTEIQTLRLVEALVAGGYRCVTVCYFEYDFGMVQEFERVGSKVECFSAYGRRPESTRDVYKFLKRGLKRIVEEYHPVIAHIQYMAPGAIPILILRKLGIKTILATLHTDASIYENLRLIHHLQKRKVTAFTCVSETAEKSFFGSSCLYNNGVKLKKHNHFTIENCLPENCEFISDEEYDIRVIDETRKHTIGVVARLESIKGVELVMPAFAEVIKKYSDCRLLLVGEGSLRENMERQQRELGIPEKSVEWTGRVTYNKLSALYKRMSLVWVPSRSEGFGLVAVEAMSQGCTVVASDTGGLLDIIHEGENGIFFHNGDVNDLSVKTMKLFSEPERIKQMGKKALQYTRRYSFEKYKENTLSLYRRLYSEMK